MVGDRHWTDHTTVIHLDQQPLLIDLQTADSSELHHLNSWPETCSEDATQGRTSSCTRRSGLLCRIGRLSFWHILFVRLSFLAAHSASELVVRHTADVVWPSTVRDSCDVDQPLCECWMSGGALMLAHSLLAAAVAFAIARVVVAVREMHLARIDTREAEPRHFQHGVSPPCLRHFSRPESILSRQITGQR